MLLARSLNYRSVRELTETMDSDEFCLWVAEFELNPWDEQRADLRAGVVASTIANYAGRSRKENTEPAKPIDYMPYSQPKPEAKPDDAESIKAVIQGFS